MSSLKQKITVYFLLCIISFLFLLPFLWMLSSSLKGSEEIFKFPPNWIPKVWMWSNYPEALAYMPLFRQLFNTILVSSLCVAGTLVSTPPIAYAFSKLKWHGRDLMFGICLMTMMLPFMVVMIPLYVLYRDWGWINTFWPLFVPAFFGSPIYIFLLRQFYKGIPNELMEAARIDGGNEFTIFRLITPLTKPALIAISLMTFLGSWTDFVSPLIFINDVDLFTLSLGLQQFRSSHFVPWPYLMAACVVFTLPVIVLFFVLQRYFVEGINFSGVKG